MTQSTPAAHAWGVHLKLLGMTALWGASYPWAKAVTQAMPILTAATLRFFLAALALLLWLHHLRRLRALLALNRRQWAAMALAALCGIAVYTASFMYGVQRIPAGKAAVLFSLSPVLTLLSAAWLFGERLNARIVAGMALAVAGSAVVIAQGNPLALLRGGIDTGELLIGLCVFCWTAYTLIGRRALGGMDALTTTVCTLLLGALMLLPFALAFEGVSAWGALWHAPGRVWLALLCLVFGSTVLAYVWYFEGIRVLGAGTAAGYLTFEPVFGVLFAALWLHEALHWSLVAGGSVAFAGMVLMYLGRRALTTGRGRSAASPRQEATSPRQWRRQAGARSAGGETAATANARQSPGRKTTAPRPRPPRRERAPWRRARAYRRCRRRSRRYPDTHAG